MNTNTGPATQAQLWTLRTQLLSVLLDYFSTTPKDKVSAAMMVVARQFLRDNGITADAATLADVRKSLAELQGLGLPFTKETKQ